MKVLEVKAPAAVLDYGVRWHDYIDPLETVVTSTWTISGSAQLSDPAIIGSDTQVWIAGGTLGENLILTNRITTSLMRTDERSFVVPVRPR